MRPWLLHIRPAILPSDARDELERKRFNKSLDTVLDEAWAERAALQPSTPSTGKYPMKHGAQAALPPLSAQPAQNIQQLKRVQK